MLSKDISWFQLKNRRILIELIAILNHLKTQNEHNLDLTAKIDFLKKSDLIHLEKIFLSPEGRQWIFFAYRELKKSGTKDPLLQSYSNWLGIKRSALIDYLLDRLDIFVFSLVLMSGITLEKEIMLRIGKVSILPGTDHYWEADYDLTVIFNPHDEIAVQKTHESLSLHIRNSLSQLLKLVFKKIPGSEIFPFSIDLISEASRINFHGREQLPRISTEDGQAILNQIKLIEKALDYISIFDSSIYTYFKETPNYFVPLQGPNGTLPSSSNSSIDTMFWYSLTNQPLLVAEMIIHELSHQRLFRLQDTDPLIDPKVHGTGWDKCEIYSPWRDDPRPVNGVFHGFIVFTEAARFWMSLITNGSLKEGELDISNRRLAMLVLQLKYAKESLNGCKFTSLGATVFSFYSEELDKNLFPHIEYNKSYKLRPFFMEFHDQMIPSGSSILEVVNSHKSNWEIRNAER
jgi:hypothetical protein